MAPSSFANPVSMVPLALVPPVPNVQPMPPPPSRSVTRSQTGTLHLVERLNLSATTVSPVPVNYCSALANPNWRAAMAEEYNALITNGT
jgi:hypothetical protein